MTTGERLTNLEAQVAGLTANESRIITVLASLAEGQKRLEEGQRRLEAGQQRLTEEMVLVRNALGDVEQKVTEILQKFDNP